MKLVELEARPSMADYYRRHARAAKSAALWWGAALLALGLLGRIMVFPLSHDEQIHVTAGRLLFRELPVDFPLTVSVVRSYAEAGKPGT